MIVLLICIVALQRMPDIVQLTKVVRPLVKQVEPVGQFAGGGMAVKLITMLVPPVCNCGVHNDASLKALLQLEIAVFVGVVGTLLLIIDTILLAGQLSRVTTPAGWMGGWVHVANDEEGTAREAKTAATMKSKIILVFIVLLLCCARQR